MKEINCARIEERDLVALYLAGKLPENETEVFEAHYFACERCWGDVQRAAEIRTAFGKPVLVPLPKPGRQDRAALPSARRWRWLAAAAALALATLGVWQLTRRAAPPAPEPVLRGETAGSLPLQIETGPGQQITFRWPAHPDAQVYVVQVFRSDGVSVWRRETPQTTLFLDPATLPARRRGISLLAKVEALDTMRQVVAKSELKPLPRP